jgi:hypothetical protein
MLSRRTIRSRRTSSMRRQQMPESTSNSKKLRREVEEPRQTAQRLIEEAARFLAKSRELEKQIPAHDNRQK